MAFFQLVVKARKLRKARREYHDEKLRSIEVSRGEKVKYTLDQRIRRRKILFKRKLKNVFGNCYERLLGNTWIHRQLVMIRTDGTLENYIAKSVCGFVSGIVLTYVFFVFFVFQLHFSLVAATIVCSFVGIVMSLGLAFYPRVRCMVFLFLPQFFSKRGRQALMAYAFILALSGPAKNALYNIGVLSESLACGQEQLKEAVKMVIDLVKQPFYALRDSLGRIIKSIKAIVQRIKKILIAIKRLVISILQVIKSAFDWLANIVSICNKKLGTPYERCQNALEEAVADCQEKLGSVLNSICNVTYVASSVCYALKPLDLVCVLSDFISDAIIGVIKRKLAKFTREIKAMFYVKIKFSHSFHFETNKSRSIAEISKGISGEIKARTNFFLSLVDWVGFVTSFFFLFLYLKVVYYRYKWLTSDRFDNRYILGHMRDIDMRRVKLDKETIFPLNRRERNKYAPLTSMLLIETEKVRLAKSAIFLGITSVKLIIYMTVDYCLFWILETVRRHGQAESEVPREPYVNSVQVKGQGFLADIYRSIVVAFSPYTDENQRDIEVVPCLPNPRPPDYDTYVRIITMALFCWIMALFEPYGLRLRHVVLSQYYPDRAKQRAVWLYNHIMRSRGSFLKYARRQLRRSFGIAGQGIERVTLRERLWAVCPLLNRLAPLKLKNACLLCGSPERDKAAPHVKCPTPGCPGIYCPQCFQDLKKLCTVCMSPLEYGDLTDMSEERDSSEDEVDLSRLTEKLEELKKKKDDVAKKPKGKIPADEETPSLLGDTSGEDTSSKYSYSYQDEPATDSSSAPQRIKFKDVEAQELRDDVTMQVFDEPLDDSCSSSSSSSSSEEQVYCFGLASWKKTKKKQPIVEDDSTSIADTESWTTDEVVVDENNVIDIEIEDSKHSSDQLLESESFCKRKSKRGKDGRFKRFVKAVGKLFYKKKNYSSQAQKTYKDSIRTGDDECGEESCSSSSSSSVDCDNKSRELLCRGSKNDEFSLRKRNICNVANRQIVNSDESPCNYQKSWTCRQLEPNGKLVTEESCTQFQMKELPRHLKSLCDNTKYYEIDESESYYSPRDMIEYQADYSTMTDTRSSVDSDPSRDRSSTCVDDNDSYIYTSENNENRYDTHVTSSNSDLPDDYGFSGMSSDNSGKKRSSRIDKANDGEQLSEEEKINEDSDEKGSKYEKIKFYHRISSVDVFDNKNQKGYFRARDKSSKKTQTNEESDSLRRDKVDKETANARKRSSLIHEKLSDIESERQLTKSDASLGTQTDNDYRKESEGSGHSRHRWSQNQTVHGFQPIINAGETRDRSRAAQTRNQGTYVRFKSKKL